MIRRHVQVALAAAIAAGDDDVARAALAKVDWVLRRRARRKLERSLIDAALAANEFGAFGDVEATRHVQRIAALQVAGIPVAATDRAKVARAYAALPRVAAPRAWIATILLGVVAATAVAGTYLYLDSRPGKASRAYVRPLPPPAAGAYKDGGTPLRDPAIEQLLVEDFTTHVLQADHDRRAGKPSPERAEQAAKLRDAAPIAAHGPALLAAWRDMLAALDRWVHLPVSDDQFTALSRAVRAKVRAVSDQLAAVGVGYYLEGDVITSGANTFLVIYSYRVEEVVFVVAGDQPRRVLSLRRLDRINLVKTLLGMQSQELGDPVLLLDQIDEHVTTKIFPVLAPGAPYRLADDDYLRSPEGTKIAALGGDTVRRELATALGADAKAATAIAALLAERAALVQVWRDQLDRDGLVMSRTDDLFLPENLLDHLKGRIAGDELERVDEIEDEVARLEGPRIASRCHQLVAATIRRHEAQHGLDDDRAKPLRYPPALEAYLGDALDHRGEPRRSVERARAELSAYTSQLANDPVTPQLTLWNVMQFAFNDEMWGTPESYAAVVIAEGLGRQLGVRAAGPVVHDRSIDRERLSVLMSQLAAVPAARLRQAARGAWSELYGEPIMPIVDN